MPSQWDSSLLGTSNCLMFLISSFSEREFLWWISCPCCVYHECGRGKLFIFFGVWVSVQVTTCSLTENWKSRGSPAPWAGYPACILWGRDVFCLGSRILQHPLSLISAATWPSNSQSSRQPRAHSFIQRKNSTCPLGSGKCLSRSLYSIPRILI